MKEIIHPIESPAYFGFNFYSRLCCVLLAGQHQPLLILSLKSARSVSELLIRLRFFSKQYIMLMIYNCWDEKWEEG